MKVNFPPFTADPAYLKFKGNDSFILERKWIRYILSNCKHELWQFKTGKMLDAFMLLTSTMYKKGGEQLFKLGKFTQTYSQGADE